MQLKSKQRTICLNQIALTVCLAASCRLVAAQNSLHFNNDANHSNRWAPISAPSNHTSNGTLSPPPQQPQQQLSGKFPAPVELELELNRTKECCVRCLAGSGARDALETAASVMAPMERVLAPTTTPRRRQGANNRAEDSDYDQAEDEDDTESPDEAAPPRRAVGAAESGESSADPAALEQEAAEASEAEAADRSALDEQLQQQREIIQAQARSEAKAIREQQEALLSQQNLQQQMQLRHSNQQQPHRFPIDATSQKSNRARGLMIERRRAAPTMERGGQIAAASSSRSTAESGAATAAANSPQATQIHHRPSINHQQPLSDVQFSDQPDAISRLAAPHSPPQSAAAAADDMALLLAAAGAADGSQAVGSRAAPLDKRPSEMIESADEPALTTSLALSAALAANDEGDLHAAAQHHYGSVKGHHGDYYQ